MPRHAQEGLPPLPDGAIYVGDETDKVGESPTAAVVSLLPASDGDVLTGVDGKWASSPSAGSGALTVSAGEDRLDVPTAALIDTGDEIEPTDPTTPTWLEVRITNGDPTDPLPVVVGSWTGSTQVNDTVAPDGASKTVVLLLSAGESYYIDAGGAGGSTNVQSVIERDLSVA